MSVVIITIDRDVHRLIDVCKAMRSMGLVNPLPDQIEVEVVKERVPELLSHLPDQIEVEVVADLPTTVSEIMDSLRQLKKVGDENQRLADQLSDRLSDRSRNSS